MDALSPRSQLSEAFTRIFQAGCSSSSLSSRGVKFVNTARTCELRGSFPLCEPEVRAFFAMPQKLRRDCFVQPDGGRWSNLICSHRADVLAIFRNDTARRVKTYPRARQKVCAANVRREGEPSFG